MLIGNYLMGVGGYFFGTCISTEIEHFVTLQNGWFFAAQGGPDELINTDIEPSIFGFPQLINKM